MIPPGGPHNPNFNNGVPNKNITINHAIVAHHGSGKGIVFNSSAPNSIVENSCITDPGTIIGVAQSNITTSGVGVTTLRRRRSTGESVEYGEKWLEGPAQKGGI